MGCVVLRTSQGSQDSWSVSPEWSASLALAIVSVTRVLGLLDSSSPFLSVWTSNQTERLDLSADCNTVVAFYTTSLAQVVGKSFKPPSLSVLARSWFETSSECARYGDF